MWDLLTPTGELTSLSQEQGGKTIVWDNVTYQLVKVKLCVVVSLMPVATSVQNLSASELTNFLLRMQVAP